MPKGTKMDAREILGSINYKTLAKSLVEQVFVHYPRHYTTNAVGSQKKTGIIYGLSLFASIVYVERTGMGHKLRAGTANASTGSDQPLAPTNRYATLMWRCSTRCPEQRARKQHRRRTAHCARWRQPHRSCRQKLVRRRVRLSGHRHRDPGKGRQSAEYGSAATGRKCCP